MSVMALFPLGGTRLIYNHVPVYPVSTELPVRQTKYGAPIIPEKPVDFVFGIFNVYPLIVPIMKTSLLLFGSFLFSTTVIFAQPYSAVNRNQQKKYLQPSPDAAWLRKATNFISRDAYAFKKSKASYTCANHAQQVVYSIANNGYCAASVVTTNGKTPQQSWRASFEVLAIGAGNEFFGTISKPVATINKSHLLQDHGLFSIEYLNSQEGLRQNFIVDMKPGEEDALTIKIAVKSDLLTARLLNNEVLQLADGAGKTRLQYDQLKVWDSRNRLLEAHMELLQETTLMIVVNDKDAQYPITVDPLNHAAEWSGTATGIIPSLVYSKSVDAMYGYSVAGVGDVNADGYDDVAVGAPGLVNIISGAGNLASVGAVFVYYGSANGLATVPGAKLQPSTAAAGALFGYSIAGGDVDGDGKNDIIVGAPMDKVTISTGGSSTATGTVGKAYVFKGNNLTATSTTPLLTLQLNGDGILENGVNLSVKALFGFSVAATEDLNGDHKKDIIVGAPAYAGIKAGLFGSSVLDVQSGGAFVFLSDQNTNNFSQVKLNPPAGSLLGLGLLSSNVEGLLFGMGVDGVGDFNNDNIPDVVVGAPAGINLSSLGGLLNNKLLQGSAIVYYGTGTGIESAPGATLAATSGGLLTNLSGTLANLVNLFGYSVKGVKDANGTRTGSILVGAPLGGTLTNLLGGLKVKTGTVSVFVKKSSSVSGVIAPNQQLSSPRNDNTILGLIQSSLLFGFSMDNAYDVNCDGVGDIIVGEPAASGAQLLGANITGGAAYVYLGKADGTYQATPNWNLGISYDADLGVNVTSLAGYAVAGVRKVRGASSTDKVMTGAPGLTLDFGTGLLDLGNTMGTLFGLTAGDNGVGKSYVMDPQLCASNYNQTLPLFITGFNASAIAESKVLVTWSVSTERNINSYTVEKSTDGANWQIVAVVPASRNSDKKEAFYITDSRPYPGTSYYRLKQSDVDNSLFYTGIKKVNLANVSANTVRIANPFHSNVEVQLYSQKEDNAIAEMRDMSGRVVYYKAHKITAGMNYITLENLSLLPKGTYAISISRSGQQYVTKLIKQ